MPFMTRLLVASDKPQATMQKINEEKRVEREGGVVKERQSEVKRSRSREKHHRRQKQRIKT